MRGGFYYHIDEDKIRKYKDLPAEESWSGLRKLMS
jgi:hypothetical protein